MKRKLSIRVSPDRLIAYQQAADQLGISRHRWAISVLDLVSGRIADGFCVSISKVKEWICNYEWEKKSKNITLEIEDLDYDEYRTAANKARMSISEWAVVMLDTAAGISGLYDQIKNLYSGG